MKKYLASALFAAFIFQANAQIISTIAGTGTRGSDGDGRQATATQLTLPYDIAVDASNNVYISDQGDNRLRKVSPTGIITTIAGSSSGGYSGDGGAAVSAQLNNPSGITIDASGNIFIADGYNHRVRKINSSGVMSTIAGTGTAGYSGDGGAATSANLQEPTDVAVDGSGNIYIADTRNDRIRMVNPSGIISTIAGSSSFGYGGDGGPATLAKLNAPTGVAIDASGNLLIVDSWNHCIRKVNTAGIISTIAGTAVRGSGGDGGAATNASLDYPSSIAIDATGNVLVSDAYNCRIRKISPGGIITTIAGTGSPAYGGDGGLATLSSLNYPKGLTIDASGNIYIADQVNYRVRKIAQSPSSTSDLSPTTINVFEISPNPAINNVTLSFELPKVDDVSIRLVDFNGMVVRTTNLNSIKSGKLNVPIDEMAAGLYCVELQTNSNKIVKHFVKQ